MGDLIALATTVTLFAAAGGVAVAKWWPRKPPVQELRGTWRKVQETVAGRTNSTLRIVLVREYEGTENARLLVAEINTACPDWNDKLRQANLDADFDLEDLQAGERR